MARLSGWQEIENYSKRSQSTLRKWKKDHNFPVVVLGGCIESDTELIDSWFKRQAEKVLDYEQTAPGRCAQA